MATEKAAQRAHRKHDEKRRHAPRLPGTRITDDEAQVMEALYARFDSKSEAIVAAAEYFLAKHKINAG